MRIIRRPWLSGCIVVNLLTLATSWVAAAPKRWPGLDRKPPVVCQAAYSCRMTFLVGNVSGLIGGTISYHDRAGKVISRLNGATLSLSYYSLAPLPMLPPFPARTFTLQTSTAWLFNYSQRNYSVSPTNRSITITLYDSLGHDLANLEVLLDSNNCGNSPGHRSTPVATLSNSFPLQAINSYTITQNDPGDKQTGC